MKTTNNKMINVIIENSTGYTQKVKLPLGVLRDIDFNTASMFYLLPEYNNAQINYCKEKHFFLDNGVVTNLS